MFLPDHESVFPDLITKEGKRYRLDDTMDFDHPLTDYDRACDPNYQHLSHFLIPLHHSKASALILSIEKSRVAWVQPLEAIVWIGTIEMGVNPDDEIEQVDLQTLEWVNQVQWEIQEDELVLFNSSLHGDDPDMPADQPINITLRKGRYNAMSAQYQNEKIHLYFLKLSPENKI